MAYDEYPPNPYVQPRNWVRETYIFDIDGTIAERDESDPNVRVPYDYDRVSEDLPVRDVIVILKTLAAAGNYIIFVSGRAERCRADTADWIRSHTGLVAVDPSVRPRGLPLYMRKDGDRRPDTIVKREIFDRHIRPGGHRIVAVFDDRNRVVFKTWREQLGLTTLHVAWHDF